MKKIFLILLSAVFINLAGAQPNNMVEYNLQYKFKEGIYIDFSSLKKSKPISTASIISNIPLNDIDYFKKLVENETIEFYDSLGNRQELAVRSIWGYSNKGTLHINRDGKFFRIPMIGSISQFVAEVKVINQSYRDPFDNRYYYNDFDRSYETNEARHYLLDFSNGMVYQFNYKNVEHLISNDEELYKEFTDLKKRKRKQLKYMYIKKYNENNPLYLIK